MSSDQRALLIDELSAIVPTEVEEDPLSEILTILICRWALTIIR